MPMLYSVMLLLSFHPAHAFFWMHNATALKYKL